MSGFALHLLRHGAPVRPGLMLGRTDMAPTAEGIAACLRQTDGLPFERLITSDLRRCGMTATAIGERRQLAAESDPHWRELDFGAWDGKAASAIDPAALGRFWADPDQHPPPDGERWSAMLRRIDAAIADLAPRPTLIVTHAGAMRAALHILCGIPLPQLWAFDLPYGALLSLQLWTGDTAAAQIRGLRA